MIKLIVSDIDGTLVKDGTLDIKFKYQDEYQSLVNYLEEETKENEKVDIRNISQAFVR